MDFYYYFVDINNGSIVAVYFNEDEFKKWLDYVNYRLVGYRSLLCQQVGEKLDTTEVDGSRGGSWL